MNVYEVRNLLESRLQIQAIFMKIGPGRLGVLYYGDPDEFAVRQGCLDLFEPGVTIEVLRITDYRWLQQ